MRAVRRKFPVMPLLLLLVTLLSENLRGQHSPWPVVKAEMKPWTRWWWMGNAVDEKGIATALKTYQVAGFGGVEIAPIYGVKGYEDKYVRYLSPRWMDLLSYTISRAGLLNMGVDLTNGTGWPFGGPQIRKEDAASKLVIQTYKLSGGEVLAEKVQVKDPRQAGAAFQFLTAYSEKGEVLQLDSQVSPDGELNWKAPAGNWELYAGFCGKTGQVVKRSSPGGEGLTLNYFSKGALEHYLERYNLAFGHAAPRVRAFYNDSYEVYGADWSEGFLALFQKDRGYDLRRHIREFESKERSSVQARLKSDYRETMAEMLLTNFTVPWTAWARRHKGVTRNQAHGSPGNLLDLYAAVDIPECETFGSSNFAIPGLSRDSADIRNVDPDPVMLKFASSAAHVAGHNLVSCETFTWLTEHFKTSLAQCKPEAEQVFLSGINHIFFHGTTYSPPEVPWPGWLFYASVNFVPSNSFWPHLTGLTSYVTRVQSVLQSGRPDNEILLYWPVYDAWNKAEGRDMPFKVHDVDVWLHPSPFYKDVIQLQKVGYSLDFVSDHLLERSVAKNGMIVTSASAPPYKVLLIPEAQLMPVSTLKKILELARGGSTIILQKLPDDVPGYGNLESRRAKLKELCSSLVFSDAVNGIRQIKVGSGKIILSEDVRRALQYAGIKREELTDAGIKFVRRKDGADKYYYLVNHAAKAVDSLIPLNVRTSSVLIMDPQSGKAGIARATAVENRTYVRVQMDPGESLILKTSGSLIKNTPKWTYLGKPLKKIEVNDNVALHFSAGGPSLPADRRLRKVVPWTSLGDSTADTFSGQAEYTASFIVPPAKAEEYVLNLGKVYQSARVWVNGKDCGILWSVPYKARIGKYLHPGKNTIRIEVANLMANRIRYMDKEKIQWKIFNDVNMVNINYQPFDASGWKVQPSGLEGTVSVTPFSD